MFKEYICSFQKDDASPQHDEFFTHMEFVEQPALTGVLSEQLEPYRWWRSSS
jgi:hypothetical protein